MGVLEQVTDRAARMKARLLSIYKGKPNFEALVDIAGAQFQEVEDAAWQMQSFIGRRLSAATGDLLNKWGALVGQERGTSVSDAEYRLRIGARIRANRSNGTAPDVYRVLRALMGTTGVLEYIRGGFATFAMRVSEYSMGASLVPVFRDFLHDSKAEGSYGVLEFYAGDEDDALRFERACFVNGTHAIGSTSLTVLPNTDGFPDAGDITIDTGTGTQESRSYTGRTTYSLTGITATTYEHTTGASVYWDDSAGLGLGDANDPDVGGIAAGARGT